MAKYTWESPDEGAPSTSVEITPSEMVLREEQSDEDIKSIISDVQDFGKLANSDKNTPLGGRFIGSIPLVVYNGWLKEYRLRGHEHFTLDQYVTLKFNSSEYSLLRDDYATMPD